MKSPAERKRDQDRRAYASLRWVSPSGLLRVTELDDPTTNKSARHFPYLIEWCSSDSLGRINWKTVPIANVGIDKKEAIGRGLRELIEAAISTNPHIMPDIQVVDYPQEETND